MATEHLIFLSIPGLRPGDVTASETPTLFEWANRGALAVLEPTFPCVTSCVQASMLTGTPPEARGVIANGFYNRGPGGPDVAFWVAHNDVVSGESVWDAVRHRRPDSVSAVWHAQNIKGATADFIITPSPIHEADGTTKLWCYSKPDGMYQWLLDGMGHFPLQHYWGPFSNIESTRWILNAAARLIEREAPNYHWIYIPHLDYAAQKFGPNSSQARAALGELDAALADFAGQVARTPTGGDAVFLVAGEYALTDVKGAVFPNRALRRAGLLAVTERDRGEYIDLAGSAAFAMVDHQFAHVYVDQPQRVEDVVAVLSTIPGIAGVFAGARRREIGMDHPRSGDVVIVTDDDRWCAYYWWIDDDLAPPFAHTVDIHNKPGYDPVELFLDAETKRTPLDATLVRGSHGVAVSKSRHRTALICSSPDAGLDDRRVHRDTDLKTMSLRILGL